MIRSPSLMTALMIICLFASGCGGAGSIPTSPTASAGPRSPTAAAPPRPNAWTVVGGFELENATFFQDIARGVPNPGNFLIVECRVDGAVVNRVTLDPAAALPVSSIGCPAPTSMSPGAHTLAIRVVNQTRSPNTYAFRGTIFANRSTETVVLSCPNGSRSFQNGDEVSCAFTLA